MRETKKARNDMYAQITEAVIASLEQGQIPWEKPWQIEGSEGGLRDAPRSVSTGKVYRGMNWFWLEMMRQANGFCSPWWMTYRQAKNLGGTVKKGAKSTRAMFWKILDGADEIDPETGKAKKTSYPVLRSFAIFNLDQCDLPPAAIDRLAARLDKIAPVTTGAADNDNKRIEAADAALMEYIDDQGIGLEHGGWQAYYSPSRDHIQMPELRTFFDSESYYATLAHEAVHSTGHKSRLARSVEDKAAFGSAQYSREELTAELGASMICSVIGVAKPEIDKNRDAYIQSWIKKLQSDPKAVVVAGGKAGRAADYVLSFAADDGDQEPTAQPQNA